MPERRRNIKRALIVYWVMIFYIVAALMWWFIELNTQNYLKFKADVKLLNTQGIDYQSTYNNLLSNRNRNTIQFATEGCFFLLIIITGATFLIRAFKREIQSTTEQRNFMMAMTHELKTPIAVSKLNLETIQKHKLTEVQQTKLLSNTLQETIRLDTLCNNLLLTSQIDSKGYKVSKENINYSNLVRECTEGFANRFPQRSIEKNIEKGIYVDGDYFLLQIAVNNLIENAIKYSPKEKPIHVQLQKENEGCFTKVIDEGSGIQDDEKISVFKKYYRTGNEATKRAKGTGLGLYLTSRICANHDGNITIENNPLGGSIFVIKLKIAVKTLT
jgi:two-component system, OmpR family, sensor histidine kinase CiaH